MKHLILFLFATFGFGLSVAAEGPASVTELLVTPENLKVVREADKVDVCILKHIAPTVLADGRIDWKTERYEETAFTPAPAATATALRDLVLSEKTYDWKDTGGHRPQLYLRLRFHRAKDVVAIDFCFICHVLAVTSKGETLAHANFRPNSDLFLQAFLKIFPDDGPLRQVAKEAGLPL